MSNHFLEFKLKDLFNVSQHYDVSNEAEATKDRTDLWIVSSYNSYKGSDAREEVIAGSFGVSKQLSQRLAFGAGVDIDTTSFKIFLGEGLKSEMTTEGMQAYFSWSPKPQLNLYLGGVYIRLENEITAGYVHEEESTSSMGIQKGLMTGATFVVSWTGELTDKVSLKPYAHYEITKSDLHGYSETTGPEPSIYERGISALQVTKLGAEFGRMVFEDTRRLGRSGLGPSI